MDWVELLGSTVFSSSVIIAVVGVWGRKILTPKDRTNLMAAQQQLVDQLLSEARIERESLRATIHELNEIGTRNVETIDGLRRMISEKDLMIRTLELTLNNIYTKVRTGILITEADVVIRTT